MAFYSHGSYHVRQQVHSPYCRKKKEINFAHKLAFLFCIRHIIGNLCRLLQNFRVRLIIMVAAWFVSGIHRAKPRQIELAPKGGSREEIVLEI